MPYRPRSCIVFLCWMSVDTKPNPDDEGNENKFNGGDEYRDSSVKVLKPPYCQKCLHRNCLRVKS